MKVSKNWLSDYIDLSNVTDEELFKNINFHVCEIATMTKMVEANNLTIAHVLECEMHPDSDHLHVCQVEIRPGEVSQIVCGAPNVCKGAKVICALPGAILPGNFKIKPSKIRGVESNGMLCSLQELGIEDKYVDERFKNGIYLFDDDAKVGEDPLKYLGFDDTVIDIELTSNRSDLLSIEGVAYDVAATLGQKIEVVAPSITVVDKKNPVSVSIETDKCYKYSTRYIENVTIKESPLWMKARLIASGVRPINNIVDITNYVLMELGQPLHAFDADLLGNTIVVRNAHNGEVLKTLDNIERTLNEDDIVITNGTDAVCVAGVMGGLTTEVLPTTKNVILEAAYFEPLSIRKTSSKLGLKSESSVRFERKIDYNRVERALDYAAQLMQELADATVYEDVVTCIKKEVPTQTVEITAEKVNSVLGTSLTDSEVQQIFDNLCYSYEKNDLVYTITLPSRRMDLEPSAQDIIEDVARMNGYDNIPTTIAKTRDKGALTYSQKRTRLVRQILANMGLNEAVSYSLISKNDLGLYVENISNPVEVLMPLTEDRSVMRQSLLNGVVDSIQYNKARKIDDLALFEIGNTYSEGKEELKLAIALTGRFSHNSWKQSKIDSDFYVLKGIIEALFDKLSYKVSYQPYNKISSFHPGRCAQIMHNNTPIGIIAELHPKHQQDLDINSRVVVCEISLHSLINEENTLKYHPINKFPSITRDLAIVCKKEVPADDIKSLIAQTARKYLVSIELFDVYTGENVLEDEKSLAFKMVFADNTKTLETQEVDKVVQSILNRLEREYNAKLR